MARKRPSRQWQNQSLMVRLAALESASVLSAADYGPPPIASKYERRSIAFFVLGFACAMLFGAIAVAILVIASPEPARANTLTRAAAWMTEAAMRAEKARIPGLTATSVWSLDRLPVAERQLWWRIPAENRM
jgi:hypothetical protein